MCCDCAHTIWNFPCPLTNLVETQKANSQTLRKSYSTCCSCTYTVCSYRNGQETAPLRKTNGSTQLVFSGASSFTQCSSNQSSKWKQQSCQHTYLKQPLVLTALRPFCPSIHVNTFRLCFRDFCNEYEQIGLRSRNIAKQLFLPAPSYHHEASSSAFAMAFQVSS